MGVSKTSLGATCQTASSDMSPAVCCLLLMLFTVGHSGPIGEDCDGNAKHDCGRKKREAPSVFPDLDHAVKERSRRETSGEDCDGNAFHDCGRKKREAPSVFLDLDQAVKERSRRETSGEDCGGNALHDCGRKKREAPSVFLDLDQAGKERSRRDCDGNAKWDCKREAVE